jgi:AraC-like DNA-binding protein
MDSIYLVSPAPPLRDFVRFYAQRHVRVGGASVVHPVPARAFPLLEFVLGDDFHVLYRDDSRVETSPRTILVGPQTHCRSRLKFQGTVECFVIMFQPCGLSRLFGLPTSELTDRAYDAHSVLGPFASRLQHAMEGCRTVSQRARLADACLLRYALAAERSGGISAAAAHILSVCGNAQVSDIARASGMSVRQFERRFAQHLGVRPKLFARIVRFEAALDSKARSLTKSWTDVAHEFGYYDQMHMIHDFAVFTGETPTHILGEVESLFRERIQAIRSGRAPENRDRNIQLIL